MVSGLDQNLHVDTKKRKENQPGMRYSRGRTDKVRKYISCGRYRKLKHQG